MDYDGQKPVFVQIPLAIVPVFPPHQRQIHAPGEPVAMGLTGMDLMDLSKANEQGTPFLKFRPFEPANILPPVILVSFDMMTFNLWQDYADDSY